MNAAAVKANWSTWLRHLCASKRQGA